MRTTIDLPAGLLDDAMRVAGVRTKTMTIILGLKEILRQKDLSNIRRLRGKLVLDVDLASSRKR